MDITIQWVRDFNKASLNQGAPQISEKESIVDEGVICIGSQVIVCLERDVLSATGFNTIICPNRRGDPIQIATAIALAYESKNPHPKKLGMWFDFTDEGSMFWQSDEEHPLK